ncbi:MAG: hypothetical protein LBO74_02530 [Candidatus Symbiothrix sp.]|jgi:hypothetical protein|nr:hypothetical protein [Candidatus Symbiothrix sp.]
MNHTENHEQLSDYWLVNRESNLNNLFDLVKLQNAVANFVKIISGRNIPVEFKVNNEKSTIDKIIISADLSNIDATVGLAIHETLSLIYTTKWITSKLITLVNDDYVSRYGTLSSSSLYPIKKRFIAEIENIYRLIEYWRLDDFAIRTSPGYKGYITESYRWFFNPDRTTKMFVAEMLALTNLGQLDKCTYNHLLYALFAQAAHSDCYKGICTVSLNDLEKKEQSTAIYKMYGQLKSLIDINAISRLKNAEDSLNLAIDVWETIQKARNDPSSKSGPEGGDTEKLAADVMKAAGMEMEKKSISVSHKEELKILYGDLSNKNQTYYDNRRIKVIVLNELNRDMIFSGRYTFFETEHIHPTENSVIEGIRLGNQLARKISFRNNERQTHFSRLQKGKIDKRLLHSVICGNNDIFYQEKEESFPAVNIHISIDGSHSMQGTCFLKSIKTAVAIAQAAFLIKNIHVTISFRYHLLSEGTRLPVVLIAYDSKRDKISKIKQLFPFLKASGPTPEGLCYSVITDWIEKEADENSEKYFVNFYDGLPGFVIDDRCCYEGQPAIEHIRNEILRMKRKGIHVLSYFIVSEKWNIGEIKSTFADCQYMYGNNAEMININALGELARSLNNLIAK